MEATQPLPFSRARAVADVEVSLRDFSFSLACLPGAAVHDGDDVKWCYTGAPRLNRIMGARFRPSAANRLIDATLAFFASRRVPVSWYVGPSDAPVDLPERLDEHGLRHRGDWTGMAYDLATADELEPAVDDFAIATTADRDADLVWAATAASGFAMPPESAAGFARVIGGVPEESRPCSRRYIGYLDGMPVATSALHLANGLAGIYYVCTVPTARRRGLATAMTRHALAEARAAGVLTAVLQASPAGAPVYRAMGFVACSVIPLYDYSPSG